MARYCAYLLNDLGETFHEETIEAFDDTDSVAAGWDLLVGYASHPNFASFGIEIRLGGNLIFNSWVKPP